MSDAIYACLDFYERSERLKGFEVNQFRNEAETATAELQLLSEERATLLRKEAEAASSHSTWNHLSNLAQYVAGVGTIVLGTMCGGWPGACLVASGVIGIGNRVITDTHLLQSGIERLTQSEELQRKLLHNIETTGFLLQFSLGLAGGVGAGIQGMSRMITTLTSVTQLGPKFGVAYYDKKTALLQARLRQTQDTAKLTEQNLLDEAKRLEQHDDMLNTFKNMVQNYNALGG